MANKMKVGGDKKYQQTGQKDDVKHIKPGQSNDAGQGTALKRLNYKIADNGN